MPWDARGVQLQLRYGRLSRARASAALLFAAALVGAACQGPAPRVSDDPSAPGERSAPAWVDAPLSWEKLGEIERWLEQSDSVHDRGLLLEARLQLAEGRVEFTRREADSGAGLQPPARARLELAGKELAALGSDAFATPGQRTRAQISLARSESLLKRAPAAVAAAPQGGLEGVLPRGKWRARAPRQADMTPVGGPWTRITVHHSAEVGDTSPGVSLSDSVATLQRIQKVHMDRGDPDHGWADIGYHFLIDGSGRVFEGRGLKWQGAHARGDNNVQNIGVCLLGDYSRRPPGRAELQALEELLDALRERYRIPLRSVATHRELTATACPGPALQSWVERYRRGVVAKK